MLENERRTELPVDDYRQLQIQILVITSVPIIYKLKVKRHQHFGTVNMMVFPYHGCPLRSSLPRLHLIDHSGQFHGQSFPSDRGHVEHLK